MAVCTGPGVRGYVVTETELMMGDFQAQTYWPHDFTTRSPSLVPFTLSFLVERVLLRK